MATLKSRQQQIPNGFRFQIPELGFKTTPYISFDNVVQAVMRVVRANPGLAAKRRWPTDLSGIENWVDSTNAEICKRLGYYDYINLEGDLPKPPAPSAMQRLQSVAGAVRKINSGANLLLDWDNSGEPPVVNDVAESRAAICVECPKNSKGDLTRWFTVPASEIIRNKLGRLHRFGMATSRDSKLFVCEVCLCPLKLKVHTPQHLVVEHLSPETRAELPTNCWILK